MIIMLLFVSMIVIALTLLLILYHLGNPGKPLSAKKARKLQKKNRKAMLNEEKDIFYASIREAIRCGRNYMTCTSYVSPEILSELKKRGFDVRQDEGDTTVKWEARR